MPGFVVLPDIASAGAVGEGLPWVSPRVFRHVSGRPWLVGRWPFGDPVVVTAGSVRLAVIGICPVTVDRLRALAAQVRTLSDVDDVAGVLPGSVHVVASVDGRVRVQGGVTGLRRVFHTRVRGVVVAADRADVLAAMTDAPVDDDVLAARLVCGTGLPSPLADQPAWRGISAVAPHDYLLIERDHASIRRWWQPPPPELSLSDGAAAVREALTTAMHHRGPAQGRWSADLSGGMDSTTLCCLAARENPQLLTYRTGEAESGNDDHIFAAQAQSDPVLAGAEHLVIAPETLPLLFADPARFADREQPALLTRTTARMNTIVRLLAERGSRRHLAGYGGDELFGNAAPAYLHRLARRHPLIAWRHLRGYAALRRWPLWSTLASLARPGTVSSWWTAQAEQLTEPPVPSRRAHVGWGLAPLRAPAWATRDAVALTRAALHRTAEHAMPLADDPGQHQFLLLLRTSTSFHRPVARLFADAGVELDMPMFDDRLAEAVLAVRPHERYGPTRYKPLLAEAMRGLVPAQVLGRATKGEFGQDSRVGLRTHLPALLELFADSALAERGLINPTTLRGLLTAPHPDNTVWHGLEALIGCETWLRAASSLTPTSGSPDAAAPAS